MQFVEFVLSAIGEVTPSPDTQKKFLCSPRAGNFGDPAWAV